MLRWRRLMLSAMHMKKAKISMMVIKINSKTFAKLKEAEVGEEVGIGIEAKTLMHRALQFKANTRTLGKPKTQAGIRQPKIWAEDVVEEEVGTSRDLT